MSIYGQPAQSNATITNNPPLSDVLTVVNNTTVFVPTLNADTVNCTTINATTENIEHINDWNVEGYVHATEDVIAFYDTPQEVSLADTAATVATFQSDITTLQSDVSTIEGEITSINSALSGKLNNTGPQNYTGNLTFKNSSNATTVEIVANGVPYVQVGTGGYISAPNGSFTSLDAPTIASENITAENVGVTGTVSAAYVDVSTLLDATDAYFGDSSNNNVVRITPNNLIGMTSTKPVKAPTFITSYGILGETGSYGGQTGVASFSDQGDIYARSFVQYNTDAQINQYGVFSGIDVQVPGYPSLVGTLNGLVGPTGTIGNLVVKQPGVGGTYGYINSSGTGTTGGQYIGLNPVNNKCYYVGPNGSDTNSGLSEEVPLASLSYALTIVGNSGNSIIVFPGTYSGNVSITNTNITIAAAYPESAGIVNFTGTFTFTHTTSSCRLNGISVANIAVNSTGALYLWKTKVTTSFSTSSNCYIDMDSCDTQGPSLTGYIYLAGSGYCNIYGGSTVGALTVASSGRLVNISNVISSAPITVSAGTLGLNNYPCYAASNSTYALSVSSGATAVLSSIHFLNTDNSEAKINLASGCTYSIENCYYNSVTSIISGTRSTATSFFDAVNTPLVTAGSIVCAGDFTVGGTAIFQNSVTNIYENVLIQYSSPTGTVAALDIQMVGGTGISNPILRITDSDTNEKFLIDQNSDLRMMNGSTTTFLVTNSSGDVSVLGTMGVTGTSSFGTVNVGNCLNMYNVSSAGITGLTGVTGSMIYNTTAGAPYVFNGATWTPIGGGSFNPVISGLTGGDTLYYDGTNWVNGYYVKPPTLTSNFRTLTAGSYSTPYSFGQTGVQYQIYQSDGTTLVSDSGFLSGNPSYTDNSLTLGTTYKGQVRQYGNWANAVSPWTTQLSFTPSDAILGQLTTSAAAYNAAATNAMVQITSTEYNNIVANISGMTGLYNQVTAPNQSSITQKAICPYGRSNSVTNAAYFVAFTLTSSGASSSGNAWISMSSNQNNLTSGQQWMALTIPSGLTSGTQYYFCWKQPSNLVGDSGVNVFQYVDNGSSPAIAANTNPSAVVYYANLSAIPYAPGDDRSLNNGPSIYDYPCMSVYVTQTKQW